MQIPREILDTIVLHAMIVGPYSHLDYRSRYRVLPYGRRTLAAMRLVNKAFCQSSSPRLFQHIKVRYSHNSPSLSLERLNTLSQSPYAPYVRQVDIQLYGSGTESELLLYVEDLAGLVPLCIARLPNIRNLRLFYGLHRGAAAMSPHARKLLVGTLATALRYVDLPHLEVFDIDFPTTSDFGRFLEGAGAPRIRMEHNIARLRHLGLLFQRDGDGTEQPVWPGLSTPRDEGPPSETFATDLLKLLWLAKNLDSLSIRLSERSARPHLQNLVFPILPRLKSLRLFGISVAADILLHLINGCSDSIRVLALEVVELDSGTWFHVFRGMSGLPSLVDFSIAICGYSSAGTSSHLRSPHLPESENSVAIRTANDLDNYACGNLERRVLANRSAAGLGKAPENAYKLAELPSLESEMERRGLVEDDIVMTTRP